MNPKGRKPIDPDGKTRTAAARFTQAVWKDVESSASRNGRSISQEILARCESGPTTKGGYGLLVDAFVARLQEFGLATDAASIAESLVTLLAAAVAGAEPPARTPHEMVAGLTAHWARTHADAAHIRDAIGLLQ